MSRTPLRIASVGECTTDFYLDLQRQFVGGISLNFAVNARRCGADTVSLVSCAGDDQGAWIRQTLEREAIDTSHLTIHPGATARQDISVTPNGERIFPPGGYQAGVLSGFRLHASDLHFIQCHNVLASACFKQVEPLFRQVMETLPFDGWRVADFLDLSDYNQDVAILEQFSERLEISFISGDHELMERLRPLSRVSRCLFVVTLGREGSVALIQGEPVIQPSIQVERVVDSTGCGDAFQSAFTVSYWREGDAQRALQCGAEQAARVLQHFGAIG